MGEAVQLAGSVGRMKIVDTSFNLNETYTLWSGLIGGMFLALSYFGCDQSQVQRYLTAKSISQGRTSLLMSAFIKIPMQLLILFIGVMVFIFYQFNQPPMIFKADDRAKVEGRAEYQALNQEYETAFKARQQAAIIFSWATEDDLRREALLNSADMRERLNAGANPPPSPFGGPEFAREVFIGANQKMDEIRQRAIAFYKQATGSKTFNDTNYVFPSFVTKYAPPGVVGLLIAAIFAAAMSTIAAELASLSTATVMDFYRRHFKPEATDAHYLRFSKLATGAWGLFACIVALNATKLGSLIEVVNKFGSYFYGSILGVFVLALGTKRANGNGAFFGLLAGMLAVAIVSNTTKVSFLWYNVVGCVVAVAAGLIISWLFPVQPKLQAQETS